MEANKRGGGTSIASVMIRSIDRRRCWALQAIEEDVNDEEDLLRCVKTKGKRERRWWVEKGRWR